MYTYIYGGVFLIGLVLAFFALKHYRLSSKIMAVGVRTEAEVIDFITIRDSDGDAFKPAFEYVDLAGTKKVYNGEIAYSQPTMKIGDKLPIIFNPNNDGEVKLASYWGIYRWTIVLLMLSSPFLIIGGGYLMYIR